MVAKLLSVDELFAKRSLQAYLKKMKIEYCECLKAVDGIEECCSEDELRAKRTRVSLLAPLVRTIGELETKQREMTETETLLEGEGIVFIIISYDDYSQSNLQKLKYVLFLFSIDIYINTFEYMKTSVTEKICFTVLY